MKDTNGGFIGALAIVIVLIGMMLVMAFFKLDWITGEHGRLTVTAVDKNLFGTHTIYARNSESLSGVEAEEIRYCIDADDTEVVVQAKEALGKKNTKLVYPDKRIGFVFFDKCGSAPIKNIMTTE